MLPRTLRILPVATLLLPAVAHAHPGDHAELNVFLQGALHPLTGLDHLIFMLGLGVYAANRERRHFLLLGMMSVIAIVVGALPLPFGLPLDAIEAGVLASLALMGVALSFRRAMPLVAALIATFVLSCFHGLAHGATGFAAADRMAFIAGLVLTSGALFSVGGLIQRKMSPSSSMRISPDCGKCDAVGGVPPEATGICGTL